MEADGRQGEQQEGQDPRHDMRENDFASWLQYGLWAFIKQNGSYVLLVLALAFLGYQLWSMHKQKQENERINAWADLYAATDQKEENPIAKLLEVVDKHPIPQVQAQAWLELGGIYVGMPMWPENMEAKKLSRPEATDKAIEAYKKALSILPDDKLIAVKAHLGLAAAYENQTNAWDKARAEYQIIAAKGSPYGAPDKALAEYRLKNLEDNMKAPRLALEIPPPRPQPSALPGINSPNFDGLLGPGGMQLRGSVNGMGVGATSQPGLMLPGGLTLPGGGGSSVPGLGPFLMPSTLPAPATRPGGL